MSQVAYVKEATTCLGTVFPQLSEDCIRRTLLQQQNLFDSSCVRDLLQSFALLTELNDIVSHHNYVEGQTKIMNEKFHYLHNLGKEIKLKQTRVKTCACPITHPILRVKWTKFLSYRLVEANSEEIPGKENSITSREHSVSAFMTQKSLGSVKSKSPLQPEKTSQPSKPAPLGLRAVNKPEKFSNDRSGSVSSNLTVEPTMLQPSRSSKLLRPHKHHEKVDNGIEKNHTTTEPVVSKTAVETFRAQPSYLVKIGTWPPLPTKPSKQVRPHKYLETSKNVFEKHHTNAETIATKTKAVVRRADTSYLVQVGTSHPELSKPPPPPPHRHHQATPPPPAMPPLGSQSGLSTVRSEQPLKSSQHKVRSTRELHQSEFMMERSSGTEHVTSRTYAPQPAGVTESKPIAKLTRIFHRFVDIRESHAATKVEILDESPSNLGVDMLPQGFLRPSLWFDLCIPESESIPGRGLQFCFWDVHDIPQARHARMKIRSYIHHLKNCTNVSYLIVTADHAHKFVMMQEGLSSVVVASPETLRNSEVDVAFIWFGSKPTMDSRNLYLALSAAKKKLICLGNIETLKCCAGTPLGRLVTFAEREGLVVAINTA